MRYALMVATAFFGYGPSAIAQNVLASGALRILNTEAPELTAAFRYSTSPTAYLEHNPAGGTRDYTSADGPNVAALIADLTNGTNNPITFSVATFSNTVDEMELITVNTAFLLGPSAVDLGPMTQIRFIRVELTGGNSAFRNYLVRTVGVLPEPGSAALFALGLCLYGHRYHRRKVSVM